MAPEYKSAGLPSWPQHGKVQASLHGPSMEECTPPFMVPTCKHVGLPYGHNMGKCKPPFIAQAWESVDLPSWHQHGRVQVPLHGPSMGKCRYLFMAPVWKSASLPFFSQHGTVKVSLYGSSWFSHTGPMKRGLHSPCIMASAWESADLSSRPQYGRV